MLKPLLKTIIALAIVISMNAIEMSQQSSVKEGSQLSVNRLYYTLNRMLPWKSVNNTVFIMITDYGYLKHFFNCYSAGHLDEYRNLIVVCLDTDCYDVRGSADGTDA